ncbi:hypothetical protein L873DRAFT_1815625 [Choiromyces venosus 120613-1]|uniref:Uncharacterized protein n=1 Tax=Choiromyces venosus 120613-1 TaxID=1336337 RepID=A0A3N4JIF2_9PEZI|nr:hypothetical protein L873DRAFT_1815625 [Choiromyces venosus 120613-1]
MFLFRAFLLSLITLTTLVSSATLDFRSVSDDLTPEQKDIFSNPLWARLLALSRVPGTTKPDLEAFTNNTFLDPRNYERPTRPEDTLGVHCETSNSSPMWVDITVLVADFNSRSGGAIHRGPGCSEQGSYGTTQAGMCAGWDYTTAWSLYASRVWSIATTCVQDGQAGGRFVFHRENEAFPSDQRIY